MSNIDCVSKFTTVIPWHPWLFRMSRADSSTVKLINLVTSDSVNSFYIAMSAFASKCFLIELVPCSDARQRTWWQTIHMIPGLPVFSLSQCKYNGQEKACLESFQGIGCFEPTIIETYEASKMICKVRSLKSWIMAPSFLVEIITFSNEVFEDFESDMAVGIRKLGNPTWETAKSHVIVNKNGGS